MANSIVISSGHGKYIRGAAGVLDEVNEARKVVETVARILRENGVTVKTFHDNTSHDQSTNLATIVNFHNAQSRDLDVSVHFNAYVETTNPMGTETLYVTQEGLADDVSNSIAMAGSLIDRGPKYRSDLYFLNNTNKPAILIETCFVDSTKDADLYRKHYDSICFAIAESIAGKNFGEQPPTEPPPIDERPPVEEIPPAPGSKPRPVIGKGDYGYNVVEVQAPLGLTQDGDFGQATKIAVETYQASKGLSVDGVVGGQTWAALASDFPDEFSSYPPPLPPLLSDSQIDAISDIAMNSSIANYSWRDRGKAPSGYTKGMAIAWAQAYMRFATDDPVAQEMAKPNTGNDSVDALSWYNSDFAALGMSNNNQSLDTLRHLYVLLMGLGMRESSGKHCEGRDQSASNTDSNTCEAGLFQTSFNASSACTDFINLFDQYEIESEQGYMSVFNDGVSCSSSSWACYGSGDGYKFQQLCKYDPTFAVETCGITLRNLRQHYGPINRKEAEIRREADEMFKEVQRLMESIA
jgi:peptidoglycan hydrolase-like protein with peptidoglycan-binding domain